MAPHQIQWGTTTLILDNEAFRKGFLAARRWYFADIYGEGGRAAEEPHYAIELTSEEVLRLVITPDEQGRYHFDEMGMACLPEYLGYLVGYLGGRLLLKKQSSTVRSKSNRNVFVATYQRSMTRDGTTSHPLLS